MKKVFSILWVLVIIIVLSSQVFAGIRVDPVTVEVVAPKGGEKAGTIRVGNTGKSPMQVTVSPEKFGKTDKDVKTWLAFSPVELTLEPNQTKEVNYKVTPPEDSSGELRCMVFFVADELGKNKSPIGIRFGVPVYAVVGGTEVIEAEVDSINIDYNLEKGVLSGTILVNNKSNIHIRPHIFIRVLDNKDNLVTEFSPKYGQPAQKKQVRPLMFQQSVKLEPGKYKLIAEVDYGRLYGLEDKVAEGKGAFVVKEVKEDEEK